MNDPVPAITEAAATGETAVIFNDIRRVLGVDVVNLIWRHLATISGALPWAWATLRPLYLDGTIGAEAAALRSELKLPKDLVPFPPDLLAGAGLSEEAISTIRLILAAYDRTNARALVALSALLSWLDKEAPAPSGVSAPAGRDVREPEPRIALPPLPTLGELPPATAKLVLTLNCLGTRRRDPILATMYRHMAYWPTYLALIWTVIAPLDVNGRLAPTITDTIIKARTRSAQIAVRLDSPLGTLERDGSAAIAAAIEPFVDDVIAKMVIICAVLRVVSG
jgi:hypothetical protein